MMVPLSKVKSLCTISEFALVRASRKPELEKLTLAQLKQSSQRARKLFDKWQDQSRNQARTRSGQVGFPDLDTRTQLKVRIFEEALKNFEARLAKLEMASRASAEKSSVAKPKKVRSAENRVTRASVRSELAETKASLNADAGAAKKPGRKTLPAASDALPGPEAQAAEPALAAKSSAPLSAQPSVAAPSATKRGQRRTTPVSRGAQKKPAISRTKQRAAVTAAKQSRVARSGLTSRVRGHVSARGRRAQARRDQRNS